MNDLQQTREMILVSLDAQERSLREAWRRVQTTMEQRMDLPSNVRARPLHWIGGAFCVGLVVGLLRE